jgi:lipopolysaccharide/colanic/teichoic acid biosynthesis glycosyltransferase
MAKRIFDIILAVLALAFLWPLFVVMAVVVILDSPGPPILSQPRLGRDFRVFGCFKYRSMYFNGAQAGPKPMTSEDERLTRTGRWLRRTSLDELPQFVNVLLGQMSLVGPRPEQLYLLDRYPADGMRRFEVMPGLTGWWQVNGRPQPMYEHLSYDLYYVDHQSFWLDMRIILMTVRAVVTGEGAV